jgi:hypothetical protein
MVHMAAYCSLLEIYTAQLYLALSTKCSRPTFPPSFPRWPLSRPLPVHAAPAYWLFLGAEAGPAVNASSVAIRVVAAVNGPEHFCSSVTAIWATHWMPSFPVSCNGFCRKIISDWFETIGLEASGTLKLLKFVETRFQFKRERDKP